MENINVMVCVTQQRTCERLILTGYKLINPKDDNLYVVHVVNEKGIFLGNNDDGEALEYLFEVSKKVGANLTVLRSKSIMETMVKFARDNYITNIVIGATPEEGDASNLNFGLQLQKELTDTEFTIL